MLPLLKSVFTDVCTVMILPELETFNFLCSVDFLHPEYIIRGKLINCDLISLLLVFVSLHLLVPVLSWLEQHVCHHEVLLYRLKHYSKCTCGECLQTLELYCNAPQYAYTTHSCRLRQLTLFYFLLTLFQQCNVPQLCFIQNIITLD